MDQALAAAVFVVIGFVIGYYWRDLLDYVQGIYDELVEMHEEPEEPNKPGVTGGIYNHIDEVNPHTPPTTHVKVVTPKTPQRVEWEQEQKLKEANEKFRVGPK